MKISDSKFVADYTLLVNEHLDKIKLTSPEQIPVLQVALNSVLEPDKGFEVPSIFKAEVQQICEMICFPRLKESPTDEDLKIFAEESENYSAIWGVAPDRWNDFKEIVLKRVSAKVNELAQMNIADQNRLIEDQIALQNESMRGQAQLQKAVKAIQSRPLEPKNSFEERLKRLIHLGYLPDIDIDRLVANFDSNVIAVLEQSSFIIDCIEKSWITFQQFLESSEFQLAALRNPYIQKLISTKEGFYKLIYKYQDQYDLNALFENPFFQKLIDDGFVDYAQFKDIPQTVMKSYWETVLCLVKEPMVQNLLEQRVVSFSQLAISSNLTELPGVFGVGYLRQLFERGFLSIDQILVMKEATASVFDNDVIQALCTSKDRIDAILSLTELQIYTLRDPFILKLLRRGDLSLEDIKNIRLFDQTDSPGGYDLRVFSAIRSLSIEGVQNLIKQKLCSLSELFACEDFPEFVEALESPWVNKLVNDKYISIYELYKLPRSLKKVFINPFVGEYVDRLYNSGLSIKGNDKALRGLSDIHIALLDFMKTESLFVTDPLFDMNEFIHVGEEVLAPLLDSKIRDLFVKNKITLKKYQELFNCSTLAA